MVFNLKTHSLQDYEGYVVNNTAIEQLNKINLRTAPLPNKEVLFSNIKEIIVDDFQVGNYSINQFKAIIEFYGDDDYMASFEEAEIYVSADSATEAIQDLKSSIIDIYEILKSEKKLGPIPLKQLKVLENYVVEKRR